MLLIPAQQALDKFMSLDIVMKQTIRDTSSVSSCSVLDDALLMRNLFLLRGSSKISFLLLYCKICQNSRIDITIAHKDETKLTRLSSKPQSLHDLIKFNMQIICLRPGHGSSFLVVSIDMMIT